MDMRCSVAPLFVFSAAMGLGNLIASLDVFVSNLLRSEMREDAVIQGASRIVVPESATFNSVLFGLGLMGAFLVCTRRAV